MKPPHDQASTLLPATRWTAAVVSTTFTGIDLETDADVPRLFETMMFLNGKSTGVAIRSDVAGRTSTAASPVMSKRPTGQRGARKLMVPVGNIANRIYLIRGKGHAG